MLYHFRNKYFILAKSKESSRWDSEIKGIRTKPIEIYYQAYETIKNRKIEK
jgi:hypothetical protein